MAVMSRISGYDAWSIYMAIKLHFGEGSYDAFKFNFKGPRLKESSFVARRDRYFFEKIAKRYQKREEVIAYFVANVLQDNTWIGSMSDEVCIEWSGKMQRLAYLFKDELSTLKEISNSEFDRLFQTRNGQCPLYQAYHGKRVSLETLTVLDVLCDYTRNISKDASDPLGTLHSVTRLVRQYKPFIVQRMTDKSNFREAVIKAFTTS